MNGSLLPQLKSMSMRLDSCDSFFFVDTSGQQQWLSRCHYRRFLYFYFSFPAYCVTTVENYDRLRRREPKKSN